MQQDQPRSPLSVDDTRDGDSTSSTDNAPTVDASHELLRANAEARNAWSLSSNASPKAPSEVKVPEAKVGLPTDL